MNGRKLGRPRKTDEDRAITTDEYFLRPGAADFLGVPVSFLEDAARRGDGPPFYRYSIRIMRYPKADLLAWQRAHLHAPGQMQSQMDRYEAWLNEKEANLAAAKSSSVMAEAA
jgi:hypothetical protein